MPNPPMLWVVRELAGGVKRADICAWLRTKCWLRRRQPTLRNPLSFEDCPDVLPAVKNPHHAKGVLVDKELQTDRLEAGYRPGAQALQRQIARIRGRGHCRMPADLVDCSTHCFFEAESDMRQAELHQIVTILPD